MAEHKMTREDLEVVRGALIGAKGLIKSLLAGRGRLGDMPQVVLDGFTDIERALGLCSPATMWHDGGAIARCSWCGRYTANAMVLSEHPEIARRAACDCGRPDGWCCSFVPPGPDAKWSIGLGREL